MDFYVDGADLPPEDDFPMWLTMPINLYVCRNGDSIQKK